MSDKVELRIDRQRIQYFEHYSIESDLYTADDAFSMQLTNPAISIMPGLQCELWINGKQELTGLIDRIVPAYDKRGVRLTVEGRDLCSLLTDSYCTEFITLQNMTIKAVAERLLRNVPFINRKNIVYQENVRGNLKKKKGKGRGGFLEMLANSTPHNFAQVEPGQTIAEVLKTYSMSRGMMFFNLPDGTLVFGKPKDGGEPLFHITTSKRDPKANNVIEGQMTQDYSKRYSTIIITGQQQGTDNLSNPLGATGATAINTKATVTDPDFPFYKPYVEADHNDAQSPKLHAQMLREKMLYESFRLEYKVPGHSQNGENWKINEMCHVADEVLGVEADYLIYARTFEMSKAGVFTRLRLGLPGMVQA